MKKFLKNEKNYKNALNALDLEVDVFKVIKTEFDKF